MRYIKGLGGLQVEIYKNGKGVYKLRYIKGY